MDDPQPSKGERTRQAILDSAHALFLERGYAATSMRQIAAGAGLALGGIYNHFPAKETIFGELIHEHHPYRQVLPIILATPADNLENFVRQAAGAMVTELGRRPDFMKLMMIELVEFNGRNMPALIERILPQVLPLIEKFSAQKDLIRPIPPFVFFRAFLGLFFSYYITEMLISGSLAMAMGENAFDHFIEIFLHGILADKEPA